METIRKATVEDAEILARISRETFDAAFGDQYAAADLAVFIRDNYAVEKSRKELADPEIGVWILEEDGVGGGLCPRGSLQARQSRGHPDCREIHRLYLLPRFQSGGRGARLMKAAMTWLERDRPRRVWLGVFSGNTGAQRFYERLGFRKVGEHTFKVGETRSTGSSPIGGD